MIVGTGLSGFVGSNLSIYFDKLGTVVHHLQRKNLDLLDFRLFERASVILHFAGKAHDTKNRSNINEFYQVNTELAKEIFDAFLISKANVFIILSSVKAVADDVVGELSEEVTPSPITHYGKSKLLAEEYILSLPIPEDKRVYILRPCMIYGPGNKGNLNLLYGLVSKGLPWPLGLFENQRSFCSIDNLIFVIKELIERDDIPSGIYNVADDELLSTNELIVLIAQSLNRNPKIWYISKKFIQGIASIGDKLHLPLNTERLQKLTSSYVVSNAKIKAAIGRPLPVSSREGLLKTFKSFNNK